MENNKLLIDIGMRISSQRKHLQITQEQLAEQVGISVQSISSIELGKKAVRPENLAKICKCLHVSADYILYGPQDKSSEFTFKLSLLDSEEYEALSTIVDLFNRKK